MSPPGTLALVLVFSVCEGAVPVPCRGLRCRAARSVSGIAARAAEPAAAPLPSLPPLIVRDAQPSEVDAIAELLSTAFFPDSSEPASGSMAGVVGPPFDGAPGRSPPSLGSAPPRSSLLALAQRQLGKLSAEVGKFYLKASLANRLSAEAFAQGFDDRPPAGTLSVPQVGAASSQAADAVGAAPARPSRLGPCKTAYALLVAEVEVPPADGLGETRRELAAVVELGVEALQPLKPDPLLEADGGSSAGGGSGRHAGAAVAPSEPEAELVPYLTSLAVAPAYRRRGAARQLLLRAEALAVGWGYSEVALDTAAANTAAVELYASCGYLLEGQTPLLDLPLAMLLRGDRASGRWRKQLRTADGDPEAEAEARARGAVVAAALRLPATSPRPAQQADGGAADEADPGAEGRAQIDGRIRLSVWAEALRAHGWRMRWAAAQLLLPFALSAALSGAPPTGNAAQAQAAFAAAWPMRIVASLHVGGVQAQLEPAAPVPFDDFLPAVRAEPAMGLPK